MAAAMTTRAAVVAATTSGSLASESVSTTRGALHSSASVAPAGRVSRQPSSTPTSSNLSMSSSSICGSALTSKRSSSHRRVSTAAAKKGIVTAELGDSLEEFLAQATEDKSLARLMTCMGEAMRTIAFKVRTASCNATACINTFGDEQLAVDMLANKLLFESLKFSHVCRYACSEEDPVLLDMEGPAEGGFSVAFDPLDGSSIVDTNFTVGTIFGVWPGEKLVGITGADQVAAAMGIYGPRTTYVIAIKGFPGTHEFLLQDDGKWVHVKETTEIKEGKLFSPGNLRATFDNPNYEKLVNYWVGEKYTLRYTGGMVPDVNQIIVKEKGVFSNVTSQSAKAKLRLLFEVAPLGLLIENAGGFSSDGFKSVLDIVVNNIDDRTQVCYGSRGEVQRFEEYLYGTSRLATEPATANA